MSDRPVGGDEVMRLKLDVTDIEAKVAHTRRLLDEIGKVKAGGGDASELEKQLRQQLGQLGNYNEEVKKGGELIEDFDRKGEKLAKVLAGSISPAFAQQLDLLFDLNEGVTKLSTGMLGLAAAGAGVAALSTMWNVLTEEMERAKQLAEEIEAKKREQRGEGVASQASMSERLAKLGMYGRSATTEARANASQLMADDKAPMPRRLAEEVAALRAAGLITSEEQDAAAAGMLITGTTSVDPSQVSVRDLVQKGSGEKAQQALRAFSESQREKTKVDRESLEALRAHDLELAIDAEMADLAKDPSLTPELIERIRRAASGKDADLAGFSLSRLENWGGRGGRWSQFGRDYIPMEPWTEEDMAEDRATWQIGQGIRQRAAGQASGPVTNVYIGQVNTTGKLLLNPGFSAFNGQPTGKSAYER